MADDRLLAAGKAAEVETQKQLDKLRNSEKQVADLRSEIASLLKDLGRANADLEDRDKSVRAVETRLKRELAEVLSKGAILRSALEIAREGL